MNKKTKLNSSSIPPFRKGGLGGIFLALIFALSSCGGGAGSSSTSDENISSSATTGLYGQLATDDEINVLLSQLVDSTKKSLDSTTADKIKNLSSLAASADTMAGAGVSIDYPIFVNE